MRFRKTLIFLILGLVFPLPAGARQKIVAPTLRSARADVAASLPRHGGVKPPLRHTDLKVNPTTALAAPVKPFTQEQVSNMVRDGFGDEAGAKLIEQRGKRKSGITPRMERNSRRKGGMLRPSKNTARPCESTHIMPRHA